MYRLYGMLAAVVFIIGMAGYHAIDRASNYKPATATVYEIDRKCDIVETTTSFDGKKSVRSYNGECKSIDAWQSAAAKRDHSISGRATIKVSYTAPQDGSSQTSELHFTSRDDEFYDLHAGDEVKVLVSNADPTKITRD
jgi:hypothetical protein